MLYKYACSLITTVKVMNLSIASHGYHLVNSWIGPASKNSPQFSVGILKCIPSIVLVNN